MSLIDAGVLKFGWYDACVSFEVGPFDPSMETGEDDDGFNENGAFDANGGATLGLYSFDGHGTGTFAGDSEKDVGFKVGEAVLGNSIGFVDGFKLDM